MIVTGRTWCGRSVARSGRRPISRRSQGGATARIEINKRHLTASTSAMTDREVMALLQAHGVPAGAMLYPRDILDDPHLEARGYLVDFQQPAFGELVLERGGFRSEPLPSARLAPAPRLGQDTRPDRPRPAGHGAE